MTLLSDKLPTSNYMDEVQAYFQKPGGVIQQMRRLCTQIKCKLIDGRKAYVERFAKLREHMERINPSNLAAEDPSGKAKLLYDFLSAAESYFQEINPQSKEQSSGYRRVGRQLVKHSPSKGPSLDPVTNYPTCRSYADINPDLNESNASSKLTCPIRLSRETRDSSPRIHKLSLGSNLPTHKSRHSLVTPDLPSPAKVFASDDPEVIERFVTRESYEVNKLTAERRKAEWEEVRDHKVAAAQIKRKEILDEIERYRSHSRQNLREDSMAKLSKVKEQREHNASVLEYKKLFRQRQDADIKDRSIEEYGRSLADWSYRKSTTSPLRSSHSPDQQSRLRSRVSELKQLHKHLQERSFDEHRALTLLRSSHRLH